MSPCPGQSRPYTFHIPPLQHHSLKGSFIPGAGVNAWVEALRAMRAWLIKCDDHIFSSSGPTLSILIIIAWKCSTALECTSVDPLQPHETQHLGWAGSAPSVSGAGWPKWTNTWDQTTAICKGQAKRRWTSEAAPKNCCFRLNKACTTHFKWLFVM